MTLQGRAAVAVFTVLALSLAVNFAWVGFTLSRSIRHKPPEISAARLVSISPRSLPAPLRAEIAREFEPRRDDARAAMRSVRTARQQVFAAMRAEPFDRAALAAAFTDLRQKLDDLSAIGEAAIADGLAATPADIRSQVPAPSPGR